MVALGRLRWGFLMFFGIVLVCMGIAIMAVPQQMFVYLFAVLAIIDGVATIVMSVTHRRISRFWWIYLIVGIIGVALGLMALLWPVIQEFPTFVYFVASWAIFIGASKVAAAIQLQKGRVRIFPIILGLIAAGLGIFLLVDPSFGSSVLKWTVAGLALTIGAFFIIRATVLRNRMIAEQQIKQAALDSARSPEA